MRHQLMKFPEGKGRAVTLSYDDGIRSDLRFVKILQRYGLKCTFNINNGMIGEKDRYHRDFLDHLTADEIQKEILDNGHEVAVHGDQHLTLGKVRPIEGIKDILNCRLGLEEKFGRIIRGMAYANSGIRVCYPYTDYETIRGYLKDLGIVYARSLASSKDPNNGNFDLPNDFYNWMPTAHHTDPEIFHYIEKFNEPEGESTTAKSPRLFYLWGHSFEFDLNSNWDLLEKIAQALSGKEDIWYATNMEIYDYCHAYQELIYSADGSRITNPTRIDLWMEADRKIYKIPAGETLILS